MKVTRFFTFEGKSAVFARLENGLIVHVLSVGELEQLRRDNPTAETDKLKVDAYEQVAKSARALGYNV